MKMYSILFLILILAIPTDLYADDEIADVIYLKNGRKIGGKIIEKVPGDYVVLELANGERSKFVFSDIDKIEKGFDNDSVFKIDREYTFLGMSIGTPAAININVGHWFDPFGFSFNGGYWGDMAKGLQLNVGINAFDNGRISHSFMAVFGTSSIQNPDHNNSYYSYNSNDFNRINKYLEWNYIGAVYNFHYSVIFIEIGLSGGSGDFESPQLILQGGLRFRV